MKNKRKGGNMEAQQLTLFDETVIDAGCDCNYHAEIWSYEKRKWEKCDCLLCGAKHDRPRPEGILQEQILKLRHQRKGR